MLHTISEENQRVISQSLLRWFKAPRSQRAKGSHCKSLGSRACVFSCFSHFQAAPLTLRGLVSPVDADSACAGPERDTKEKVWMALEKATKDGQPMCVGI